MFPITSPAQNLEIVKTHLSAALPAGIHWHGGVPQAGRPANVNFNDKGVIATPPGPHYRDSTRPLCLGLGVRLDIPTITALSVIVVPAFLGLFFMAGKYSLPMYTIQTSGVGAEAVQLADVGVFPMDKHGCCSQGLVFNRDQVPALISYLQTRGRGQTDLMIEEYCNEAPLRRFALGDQVMQHVGVISSRGQKNMNAQSVFAFYFEEKQEREVKKKQQIALKGIDWRMLKALEGPETNPGNAMNQGLGILPPI